MAQRDVGPGQSEGGVRSTDCVALRPSSSVAVAQRATGVNAGWNRAIHCPPVPAPGHSPGATELRALYCSVPLYRRGYVRGGVGERWRLSPLPSPAIPPAPGHSPGATELRALYCSVPLYRRGYVRGGVGERWRLSPLPSPAIPPRRVVVAAVLFMRRRVHLRQYSLLTRMSPLL